MLKCKLTYPIANVLIQKMHSKYEHVPKFVNQKVFCTCMIFASSVMEGLQQHNFLLQVHYS
jgi:2,3-bisphosphoglycerate-independent phosphoglycerate mutase